MLTPQDASTQTDISDHSSVIVTLPRPLVTSPAEQAEVRRASSRHRRHSSLVDAALNQALSIDGLEVTYLPRDQANWRSYIAMLGMNVLHQVINM